MGNEKFELLKAFKGSLIELARVLYPHYCTLDFSPMHYKLSDTLIATMERKTDAQNGLIILPRGFAKSTFVIEFLTTWAMLFSDKKYIIMVGESMGAIRKHFEHKIMLEIETNKRLHALGIRKGEKWICSKDEAIIEVICPDPYSPTGVRKLTIEAKSMGSSLRGSSIGQQRPDLILIDDLERQKTGTRSGVESSAYREEVMEWFFGQVVPLGGTCGELQIIMMGTIMHREQLLVKLYTEPMEKPLKFYVMKYGYLYTNSKGEECSLWPGKYSVEDLHQMRDNFEKLGKQSMFFNEYLSEFADPKTLTFNDEDYRYFHIDRGDIVIYKRGTLGEREEDDYTQQFERRIPLGSCHIFSATDPAISTKQKACYSSIATIAVDSESNWFVLGIEYGRWSPTDYWEQIFKSYKKWKPICMGVEVVGYQKAIPAALELMMRQKNEWMNIEEIKNNGMDKSERIRMNLAWRYKQRKVYHNYPATYRQEYESQLRNVTDDGVKGFVDLPDSVSLIADLAFNGNSIKDSLKNMAPQSIFDRGNNSYKIHKSNAGRSSVV